MNTQIWLIAYIGVPIRIDLFRIDPDPEATTYKVPDSLEELIDLWAP